jgi:XTP/dITP diphosphohydrolase
VNKVILASGNQGKLNELQQLFAGLNIELVPQPSDSIYHVEETGTTFVENAIIKARHVSNVSGLPAIADDSGLMVDALNGEPGVITARYAGQPSSSDKNMELLMKKLAPFKTLESRSARFVCVLVYIQSAIDPLPVIALGQWFGAISLEKFGSEGFGYDPIFWSFEEGKTVAQLPLSSKQIYSHRAKAAHQLKLQLTDKYNV